MSEFKKHLVIVLHMNVDVFKLEGKLEIYHRTFIDIDPKNPFRRIMEGENLEYIYKSLIPRKKFTPYSGYDERLRILNLHKENSKELT